MIIYKTTNLINGKFYIGKDKNNNDSYLGSGLLLKKAIKKYGKENFKKEILEFCQDEEELNDKEKYWILNTNAINLGYNILEGGTGGDTFTNNPNKLEISKKYFNRRHTQETKDKISKNNKRLKGVNHPHFNKKQTEITKQKRKESFLKNGFPMQGRNHSKESKNLISIKKKGIKLSEETKIKISNSNKGKKKEEVICPYCLRKGGVGAMLRWHFNNCKIRK